MKRVVLIAFIAIYGLSGCKNDDSSNQSELPNAPTFETSDIDLFWKTFDEFESSGAVSWQNDYINSGSDALKTFNQSKNLNSRLITKMQKQHCIDYYKSVRAGTEDLDEQIEVCRQAMLELDRFYPPTAFYPINFLVGALSTGGTISGQGPIIAIEMWTKTADSPISELGEWEQQTIRDKSYLPAIVIHEFVHMQQQALMDASISSSTLELSIMEGMADYVTKHLRGQEPFQNDHLHEYGNAIEEQIWNDFKDEMDVDFRQTDWLYGGNDTANGHPADMGYYVGFKILEAYSEKFNTKEEAIANMLSATDYIEIYEASEYALKFQD